MKGQNYLTTYVAILIATKLEEITQQAANQRTENRNYCEMQLFSDMATYLREVAFLHER